MKVVLTWMLCGHSEGRTQSSMSFGLSMERGLSLGKLQEH